MNKKILVAIDGSIYSSNSIDYLIRLFRDDPSLAIHLFAVVSEAGSGQNWMYEVDSLREHTPLTDRRRITAERFLRDARDRLVRNGVGEDRVTFTAQVSQMQSAKTIHHESNKGVYDALVIGRRGMGRVGEMLLGSVSAFLVEKCHEIPLWIIDGEITSNRFLLAVQCKPQSLLAADHLGFITGSLPEAEIFLYHSNVLFGADQPAAPEEFHPIWGKEWCDQYLDIENYLFYAHAQVLKDHGVHPKRITQLPMERNLEVSRDLIKQADRHNCGTIVIGRRSRDAGKGMFGGVSDRALSKAQNLALWLVG
ncbi:MAG: universal stress protein [Desulfobulbaceae bacterium]|jgi:nucleotide-binding universal stress UspA family protein|nr:universal stress protein [Desulfobulbaceae bacterium]MDY0350985.1 universal stress protein [Desulfobulbaceae bacterium]